MRKIKFFERSALRVALASWELGTSTQALLEYDYSPLSVFGSLALSIPRPLDANLVPGSIYSVTDRVIQTRNPLVTEAFVYDTSVGDPASKLSF